MENKAIETLRTGTPIKIDHNDMVLTGSISLGYVDPENGHLNYIVNLDNFSAFYSEGRGIFVSKLVVNHENVRPILDGGSR